METDRWRPHSRPTARLAGLLFAALMLMQHTAPVNAQTWMSAARLHSIAVDKFRQGRFPEAYGRFVQLANVGHAPSARLALWMCQEGPTLFGSDWDCTPDEVADWAALSRGVAGASSTRRAHREAASR